MTELFSGPFRILTGMVPSWRPWLISLLSFVFFLALSPQLPAVAVTEAASRLESESRTIDLPSIALPEGGSPFQTFFPKVLAAGATSTDLAITQSDAPEPVTAGTQLTFTITVTNATSTPAKKVIVVDTLDPNVDFNNSSECELTVPPTDPVTLTCDLGTIPGGQNKIFDVTVDVPPDVADGTTLTNNVVVSSDGIEQTPSDNEADETTQVVTEADLAVDISELDPPAIAGEPLTYRVTVDNLGPSDSQDVELVNTFTLPAGVSLAALPGGCSESVPDIVTCSLGTVDAGASAQVELTLALGPDAAKNDTISLISAASSLLPTPDPTPGNDDDNIDTTITTEADLVVTVSDDLDPVAAGTSFTYSVQVKNLGPSDSQDIEVVNTLALPAGAVIASVPSGCVQGPSNVLTCDVGVLGVNATADIAIDVSLDASLPAGESVSNNAVALSAQTADPTPGDNDVTESTLVKADSDLSIEITESADPVNVGSQLEYEVTVNNGGPSDAQNVEVTNALTLPTDVTVSSTSGCSNDPNGA
ncbi:MAG: DUF11 domain-containing protein, partial [Chloroflexi bacterium]|nr:DUF11 domain-containing protein [Chloroflexota bacterium]